MTLIPVHRLTRRELHRLGSNLLDQVDRDSFHLRSSPEEALTFGELMGCSMPAQPSSDAAGRSADPAGR
ncbi:hypothetical protein HED60_06110 [Planctomycetales bacterium ZRK34]|nr:hypothetical protein HED60_06110 [Planctomycetales bacterium ZRK34]